MATLVGRLVGTALDAAFPATWPAAGGRAPICDACLPALDVRRGVPGGTPLGLLSDVPVPLLQLDWCAPFDGTVRRALHVLKYAGERRLAVPLGEAVARRWREVGAGGDRARPGAGPRGAASGARIRPGGARGGCRRRRAAPPDASLPRQASRDRGAVPPGSRSAGRERARRVRRGRRPAAAGGPLGRARRRRRHDRRDARARAPRRCSRRARWACPRSPWHANDDPHAPWDEPIMSEARRGADGGQAYTRPQRGGPRPTRPRRPEQRCTRWAHRGGQPCGRSSEGKNRRGP